MPYVIAGVENASKNVMERYPSKYLYQSDNGSSNTKDFTYSAVISAPRLLQTVKSLQAVD